MVATERGRTFVLICLLFLTIEAANVVADSISVSEVAACPSDVSAEVREAITRQSGEPLFMLQTEAGALRSRSALLSNPLLEKKESRSADLVAVESDPTASRGAAASTPAAIALPNKGDAPEGAPAAAAPAETAKVVAAVTPAPPAPGTYVAPAAPAAATTAAPAATKTAGTAAKSAGEVVDPLANLVEVDSQPQHVSQAKHLDLTAAASNRSDSSEDLVFLSIMSNASLVAGSDGGSSWATMALCCVFMLIVFCGVFFLSQSRGSGEEVPQTTNRLPAASYLDKLGERKSMTNPDLSRAGSARKFASGPGYGGNPGGGSRAGGTAPILPERASTTGRPSFQPPTGRPSAASATPAPSITNARLIGGEEALPKLYPDLVMSAVRTRLAVPVAPLNLSAFEIDILGMTGSPLLYATLGPRTGGLSTMELSLSSDGKLLATVTPQNQILDGQGNLFVTLTQGESAQVLVRDTAGGVVMVLTPGSGSGEAVLLSQAPGGRLVERASLARRPAGRLPAEHYEVFVAPGVDAVLCLACFMALVVFIIPNSS